MDKKIINFSNAEAEKHMFYQNKSQVFVEKCKYVLKEKAMSNMSRCLRRLMI